jgi:hypothetical protein
MVFTDLRMNVNRIAGSLGSGAKSVSDTIEQELIGSLRSTAGKSQKVLGWNTCPRSVR